MKVPSKGTGFKENNDRHFTKPSQAPSFEMKDRVPSNWSIVPDGQEILATNTVTGQVFKGKISEFNKALRS